MQEHINTLKHQKSFCKAQCVDCVFHDTKCKHSANQFNVKFDVESDVELDIEFRP